VVVGWTGSRATARALHDALPLLERAEHVTVLSLQLPARDESGVEFPSLDVAAHLRTHQVDASYERVILGEVGVADHLLNRAADLDADLIVVGAPAPHALGRLSGDDTAVALVRATTTPVLLSA
jgi:nucleotide-binding universal stress UspA family protein